MLRFQTLGGWWSQVLLAQRTVMTKNGPVIVVGSYSPSFISDATCKTDGYKNMLIDIGR